MSKAKKIKMGKSYRLRGTEKESGTLVDILTTTRAHELFVVVSCGKTSGRIFTHDQYGHWLEDKVVSANDLIKVSTYDDFKIDEPVMVSLDGTQWHKRHFAGVTVDGLAIAFNDGKTSFTQNVHMKLLLLKEVGNAWNYCRRPTKEEFGS